MFMKRVVLDILLAAVSKNGSDIQQFAFSDHGLTGCLRYWLT